jgi:cytochrome c oxidase subunit 1
VVAHFHFIMVGAVIMAFMAALHYWFPKLTGRLYPEGVALATSGLIIFGFVATFLPQFLLGNMGMPRRYFEYPARFQYLNVASTAGASLLAIGFTIALGYLVWSLFYGKVAGQNPWLSRGYEWRVPSPPPKHNFVELEPYEFQPHDYSVPVTPEMPRVA